MSQPTIQPPQARGVLCPESLNMGGESFFCDIEGPHTSHRNDALPASWWVKWA